MAFRRTGSGLGGCSALGPHGPRCASVARLQVLMDRGNVFRVLSRLLAGVLWTCNVGAIGSSAFGAKPTDVPGKRRLRQV